MVSLIEKWANYFDKGLGQVSKWGWWAGAVLAVFMLLGNTYEVISRYIFFRPSGFMDELLEYAFVGIIFLVLGWAWRTKAHIYVEVLLDRLPGRLQRGVYLGGLVLSFVVLVGMVSAAWIFEKDLIVHMRRADSNLEMLLFIPMIMVGLGLTIFCLEVLTTMVKEISSTFQERAEIKPT
jgi:TRAP-type C4-dicarboxylate transport system permease small subunit